MLRNRFKECLREKEKDTLLACVSNGKSQLTQLHDEVNRDFAWSSCSGENRGQQRYQVSAGLDCIFFNTTILGVDIVKCEQVFADFYDHCSTEPNSRFQLMQRLRQSNEILISLDPAPAKPTATRPLEDLGTGLEDLLKYFESNVRPQLP